MLLIIKTLWNQDGKDRISLSNTEWKGSEVRYFPRKPKHWCHWSLTLVNILVNSSFESDKPLGYRVAISSLSPCANPSDHHFFSLCQLMKTFSEKRFSKQSKWLAIEVCQRIQENGQRRVSVLYIWWSDWTDSIEWQ